jgi:hypothetical protein
MHQVRHPMRRTQLLLRGETLWNRFLERDMHQILLPWSGRQRESHTRKFVPFVVVCIQPDEREHRREPCDCLRFFKSSHEHSYGGQSYGGKSNGGKSNGGKPYSGESRGR